MKNACYSNLLETAISASFLRSNVYTRILKRKKIEISMTEENHCYENALAERVYGILKDEFYLGQPFMNKAHAKRAAKNEIK
tara:strand:- start:204 stop:449 length:246 start_codon:yes stop_codon:yes gene_type:complete